MEDMPEIIAPVENLHMPNCIRTFSGKYVNILNPDPDTICIEDIAHALSNICRFGGHTPQFYSVAQHSHHCHQLASGKHKRAALFHDASEAFLVDMPSPIKKHLPDYRKLEYQLMTVIAKKFGFQFPFDPEIKKVDTEMLQFEWDNLILRQKTIVKLECLPSAFAKKTFLNSYEQLTHFEI